MTQKEVIFNIGFKFGELSGQLEQVIETLTLRRNQVEIEVSFVNNILSVVMEEFQNLDHSEIIKKTELEIEAFLEKLLGKRNDEEDILEDSRKVLTRIKKKIKNRKYKRKLKEEEVKELELNLKIWIDRVTNLFLTK